MKKLVNKDPEKVFLSYFGYDDGRNIKMKDMVGLFSTLNEMEPEVAMKVIDQFPELAKTSVAMAKQFCEISFDALKKNDESTKNTLMVLQRAIDAITETMKSELASEEDKKHYANLLLEIARLVVDVNKSNQQFLLKALSVSGKCIGGFLLITVAILGVGGNFKLPPSSKGRAA